MTTYTNVALTIIVVLLAAITTKLYFPDFGPRDTERAPTRGDFASLGEIEDIDERRERRWLLDSRIPLVWVAGGAIDAKVTGGYLTVDGEVSIVD